MLSPKLVMAFTAAVCLLVLSAVVVAQQEYIGATCGSANCANCMQAIEGNSPVCNATPNTPHLCYSSNNTNSGAATNAWCIQPASQSTPTCNGGDTVDHGRLCGTMKYWNCNCIANGAACNFCPCNPNNPSGTWSPNMWGGVCTNVAVAQ